ncbi:hypothetical protein BPOR_0149g00080 [Botrytis porri]|uniref:Uncharacterized protein n=1 Tax=Botrytis porri TaxID=87229 RepID=A0A4Z1KVT1_9HELO|nr:hypothetical protein BPOR_0149g00080 [Botrytis porri]
MASGTEIQPLWLTFLNEQTSTSSGQVFATEISKIFLDFLFSEDEDAVANAAKQINDSTRDSLISEFQSIYDLAALKPYEDPKQDMLLQLIVELLKLERKTFKGADGKEVDELDLDVKNNDEYTQLCIEWINLSAFYARCIAASVDDHDKNAYKFPDVEICEALEPDYDPAPGIDTDFRVVKATRYIIVA